MVSAAEPDHDRRVSVIVVTYDSAQHIEACLRALLAQDHPLDVVVVDNASRDRSLELATVVAEEHPQRVTVLAMATNLGFAGAVNEAIARTDAHAVLLCNPDARLAPDHVRHLDAALAADPEVGSAQGTLWRPRRAGRPARIDSTGHVAFATRLFGNRDEGAAAPSPGGDVWGVTGAAALHRRTMLDDIAVPRDDGTPEWLDETLFAYFDDIDLDWRARLRGWRAVHVPEATAVHERGGSGARRTTLVEELNAANRILVVAKLDDRRSLLRALPSVVVGTGLKLLWLAVTQPRVLPGVLGRVRAGWSATMRRRAWAMATARTNPATVVAGFERFDWRGWVRRWWRRVRDPLG